MKETQPNSYGINGMVVKIKQEYDYKSDSPTPSRRVILLSHSCDEWIIGTPEQAEQMIFDLQRAIKRFGTGKADIDYERGIGETT